MKTLKLQFSQLLHEYWYYQAFILSNGCTIKYSKEDVKIYITINIKSALTCFGLNNHHQGHVSVDYLNDYNFSEAKMPRSLKMFVENETCGALLC